MIEKKRDGIPILSILFIAAIVFVVISVSKMGDKDTDLTQDELKEKIQTLNNNLNTDPLTPERIKIEDKMNKNAKILDEAGVNSELLSQSEQGRFMLSSKKNCLDFVESNKEEWIRTLGQWDYDKSIENCNKLRD